MLNAQEAYSGTVANRYYKFDGWYMDAAATIHCVVGINNPLPPIQ